MSYFESKVIVIVIEQKICNWSNFHWNQF